MMRARWIIAGLRGNGIPDEQVQAIRKALARLRLALEQKRGTYPVFPIF